MRFLLHILLVCVCSSALAQNTLEIDIVRFNTLKTVQLYTGSPLEYKVKGEQRYRLQKMVALHDSLIIFEDDSSISLSQIKAIKLRNANHLYPLFSGFFITGGVLFVGLDTFNNLINGQPKIVDERAVIVGASLITLGLLVKQMAIKRVRIGKHRFLRILDLSYQDLNTKK
jgi:hypothetical protein